MKINIFQRQSVATLFLMALPAVVQAQFIFTINSFVVTITGYNGSGGVVVIPNTINGDRVAGIGDEAFAYCTNLTGITIANGVTGIGEDAFAGCSSLSSIVLGSSIASIGNEVFYDCASLTNILIPNSVTNIGEGAFLGCVNLKNISVNAGNAWFGATNGVLFDQSQDTLIGYPEGLTNSSYTIPNSVTNIGPYAFAGCSSLINLAIPWQVNTVSEFAFSECAGLTSIVMANVLSGNEWVGPATIGAGAFAFCSSLTNVVIAGTVTNLEGLAFAFCTNLTSANFLDDAPPDAGTAFYGDPEAVGFYLPGTIGWGPTFGGAPTVEEPTPASEFQGQLVPGSITIRFYSPPLSMSPSNVVVIPSTIDGTPVTGIEGNGAFGTFLSYVTSVTIPNSVTNIGTLAFYDCTGLASIAIPGSITSIGSNAFENCTSLTNVIMADGLTSIGDEAFEYCRRLTNVVIASTVTNIGDLAFDFCTNLTSINIPASVVNIGVGAFGRGTVLTNIFVDAANPFYSNSNGILFDKAEDSIVQYPAGLRNGDYVIPNSVTDIAGYAFSGCASLARITIPNGVTSIGDHAFYGCTSLTEVVIPNNVTNIGDYAFVSCWILRSAYFQANAPPDDGTIFLDDPATIYYLPGTTGWESWNFSGATLWNPQATNLTTAGGQFGFNITGPNDGAIIVNACTNLANPVWVPVATNTLSGSGVSSFSDPQWTNYPNRYYRFAAP